MGGALVLFAARGPAALEAKGISDLALRARSVALGKNVFVAVRLCSFGGFSSAHNVAACWQKMLFSTEN